MARVARVAGLIPTEVCYFDSGHVGLGALGRNVGRLPGLGKGGMSILIVVFDVGGMGLGAAV